MPFLVQVQILRLLRERAASGNYDDDEINIAISHAKKMIAVAKKKLANIKQEVMNKKDDDKYISSKERCCYEDF